MRKGVSPVISTLLMLAIVVAFGTGIMIWSGGSLSTFSISQGLFLQQGAESVKERMIVEFVEFQNTTPKNVVVHVRNVGENDIKINTIAVVELSEASTASIFESADMTVQTDCTDITESDEEVAKGCWKSFTVEYDFNTGEVYKITVMTTNGNKAIVHATA
jgi:flagellin-like protein